MTWGSRQRRTFHSQFGVSELAEIGLFGVPTFCKKNENLAQQGAPSEHLLAVVSGVLRAYRLLSNGCRRVMGFLMPRSFIGLENSKAYNRSVDAITDAQLQRYERKSIKALIEQHPKAGSVMFEIMSDALSEAEDQQIVVGQASVSQRLTNFLLYLADKQLGSGQGERTVVPLARSGG